MLLGGAAVNALAFSGSNYLFSMLRSSGVDEERRRHDKAVEQLQAAHEQWSKQRTERLDWINEELRQKNREIAFVVVGLAATGLAAYKLAKWSELNAPDSTHSVSSSP